MNQNRWYLYTDFARVKSHQNYLNECNIFVEYYFKEATQSIYGHSSWLRWASSLGYIPNGPIHFGTCQGTIPWVLRGHESEFIEKAFFFFFFNSHIRSFCFTSIRIPPKPLTTEMNVHATIQEQKLADWEQWRLRIWFYVLTMCNCPWAHYQLVTNIK